LPINQPPFRFGVCQEGTKSVTVIPEELQEKPGPPSLLIGEGFSATIEGYAWEQDLQAGAGCMQFWYISLTASALQEIMAVWANLIKGEVGTVQFNGLGRNRFVKLWNGGPQTWKRHLYQLPQAQAHQLVMLPEPLRFEAERTDFVIMPKSEDDASWFHMRYLRKKLPIPLLPEWEDWLWRRALYRNEAFRLESSPNVIAYRCEPNVEALKQDISEAGFGGELYLPPPKNSAA